MCFSPQADVAGGLLVTAIGVDSWRHVGRRRGGRMLAALPLLLGVHQLIEVVVWWGPQGRVSPQTGRTAMWLYLLIAFVILPVYVPLAVLMLEPSRRRKLQMVPFVVLGAVVAAVLLVAMIGGPVTVALRPWHLAYSIHVAAGGLVVGLYVVAICGALLFSGYRHVAMFGLANLVAVALIAWVLIDGFASLWCGYAALSAAAIAFHMRYTHPDGDVPLQLRWRRT
ncbi:MAG TPA: DUF6629 family protein [Acidimicrobiales bacterium]|jgi:nitrate reductase NapE component|nr:DUF6629 family protein [Acidimicrobiales bacterium]